MPPFPYPPRPGQERIAEAAALAVASGSHLVLESATGTGKTVSVLAGVLDGIDRTRDGRNRRVLYLTRTHSQQRQVMVELRAIAKLRPAFGVALQGRVRSCFLSEEDAELAACDTEEHGRLCSDRKRQTTAESHTDGGCRFYRGLINFDKQALEARSRADLPTFEEFSEFSRERGLCAYEANKLLLRSAEVVCAPYVYFFNPFIRRRLLEWMGASLGDLVVVLDEAHNLPDYAREVASLRLSLDSLEVAKGEAALLGDPEVLPDVTAGEAVDKVEQAFQEMASAYIIEEDGIVPPGAFEAELMAMFQTTSTKLALMAKTLEVFGEQVRTIRQKERKVPRSYLRSAGMFVGAWFASDAESHAKLISTPDRWQERTRRPSLELYCLDPSLASAALFDCAATVHMSGTLTPLEAYRDQLGLPAETELLSVPCPYPPENRLVVYSPNVTSRHETLRVDPTMERRLYEEAASVLRAVDRNTVVFFPSFRALAAFAAWSGPLFERHRMTFIEEPGMDQEELMSMLARFKAKAEPSLEPRRGRVLLAVIGGRLSEGIDFPDDVLEVVLIAGIPYPKPTARTKSLVDFFETKFGRGWEYAVEVPTTRRLLQAVGRAIRGPTDIGAAVILDYRAGQFADRISRLGRVEDVAQAVAQHLARRISTAAAFAPSDPSERRRRASDRW
ncbi:MAG TPA: ATP-dependent DNA helicase [Candidatus Thermoplasmatota archaeon]|nr:ATP-dependent DNA helicase [Candidatus Thermoplasmatota archaeon]